MLKSPNGMCPDCTAEYMRRRYHEQRAIDAEDLKVRLEGSQPRVRGICTLCGEGIRGNQYLTIAVPTKPGLTSAGPIAGEPEEIQVCRVCHAIYKRLTTLDTEAFEQVVQTVIQQRVYAQREQWQLKQEVPLQEFGYVNPRTIEHSYDPITYMAPDRATADEMYYQDFPEERPEPKTPQEPQAA